MCNQIANKTVKTNTAERRFIPVQGSKLRWMVGRCREMEERTQIANAKPNQGNADATHDEGKEN